MFTQVDNNVLTFKTKVNNWTDEAELNKKSVPEARKQGSLSCAS